MGLLSASPSLPPSLSSPPRIVRVDVSTPTAPPSPGTPPQHSDSSRQVGIPLEEDEGALKKTLRKGVDDKSTSINQTTTTSTTPRRRKWTTFLYDLCLGGMHKNPPATAHFDGLRGIACLTVLVWHFLCAYYPGIAFADPALVQDGAYSAKWGRSWLLFFFNGPLSVDIFYGLSGRVLLNSYMSTGRNSTLVSAMFRRILRLMVPFAVIVIVAWKEGQRGWVQYGVQASVWTRSGWLPAPTLGGGVASLRWRDVRQFINDTFTEINLPLYIYNPRNLWTIRTEWRGSLAVFSLGFLMKNLHSPCRWLLYPLLFRWYEIENGGALLAFIVGFFLCDLERNTPFFEYLTKGKTWFSQFLRVLLVLGSGGVWVYAQSQFGFVRQGEIAPLFFRRWTAIGTWGCLMFVQLSPPMRWLLCLAPIRFIGYVSFCLYLVHGEVLNTFAAWLFLELYQEGGEGGWGYVSCTLLVFAASFPLMVGLAWVMTVLVDDPSVKVARWVYVNLFCAFDEKLWLHRQGRRVWVGVKERGEVLLALPVVRAVLYSEIPKRKWRRRKGKEEGEEEVEEEKGEEERRPLEAMVAPAPASS